MSQCLKDCCSCCDAGVDLQGKLIAGINSRVQLYDWQLQKDSSRGLVAGAGQSGLVLALYLACRGDFIVVGKSYARSHALRQYHFGIFGWQQALVALLSVSVF